MDFELNFWNVTLIIFVLSLLSGAVNAVWQVQKQKMLPSKTPKGILDERFAKGEIDEGEYGRRLNLLQFGPPLELTWHHDAVEHKEP